MPGPVRALVDAAAAIVLVTMLVSLTDGFDSPFFFGYFLVVAGAALVFGGRSTFALAGTTVVVYLSSQILLSGGVTTPEQTPRVAVNILALGLLTYLAVVVAREQRRAREEALRLSRYDPLTGLLNRAAALAAMEREIRRTARSGRRFGVLMLDLDDLKPINDTYGHHIGDRVLRAVSEVIRRSIRLTDVAGRYGGDEFVVLLPETDPTGAYVLAEKLRLGVLQMSVRVDDRVVRTSVSIGAVTFPDDGTSTDELMLSVDAAMYESKRQGKDRIVTYTGGRARTPAGAAARAGGPPDTFPGARDRRRSTLRMEPDDHDEPGLQRPLERREDPDDDYGIGRRRETDDPGGRPSGGPSRRPRPVDFEGDDLPPARGREFRIDPGREFERPPWEGPTSRYRAPDEPAS